MIITQTPLRIGIVGGGSDIPAFCSKRIGRCINAAIDKYVYVLVKKRFDNKIYLKYSDNEIVESIDDIKHDFIREAIKYVEIDHGLEIVNFADIPTKGTGLGSSSSFLVGLLNALYNLKGQQKENRELAEIACDIEINKCGKPIGFQDQFIAAFGGLRYMQFNDPYPDSVYVSESILKDNQLEELSKNFIMFYTGITRNADLILEKQSNSMINDIDKFNLVLENTFLTEQLYVDLYEGNYDSIGQKMKENWELKRQIDTSISNSMIDLMNKTALENGALGAKITGAGGGGFLVVYAKKSKHDKIIKNMKNIFTEIKEMPIKFDKYGTRVLLNVETHKW